MYETRIKINGRKETAIKAPTFDTALLVYKGAIEMLNGNWSRPQGIIGPIKYQNSLFDLFEQGSITVGQLEPVENAPQRIEMKVSTTRLFPPKEFEASPVYTLVVTAFESFPALLPGIVTLVLGETIINDEHLIKEMDRPAKVHIRNPIERTKEVVSFLRELVLALPDGSAKWEMIRDILNGKLRPYEN